jgi:hypothetical protein
MADAGTLESVRDRIRAGEPLTVADIDLLLAEADGFQALGQRRVLVLTDEAIAARRPQLRERLPAAVLRPHFVSRRPNDPDFFFQVAAVGRPSHAPADFRHLPPVGKPVRDYSGLSVGKSSTTVIGSGVPFADHPWGAGLFSRCMTCAGSDTLCIYADTESVYDNYETTTFDTWEYVCRECGAFSSARRITVR